MSLSATPNRGYTFDSWTAYKTDDQSTTVTVRNNQFTMPDYDVTVVANFTALTAYNLSGNGTNGSVAFSVPGVTGNVTTAYPGETVTATATGASGYEFSSWETPTGVPDWTASGSTATFTMPSAAVTLTANFAKSTTTYYNKVTSASDLTDGQYLIVYETGGVAFNGGLETLDATSNTINVSISDNKILSTAATTAAEFTIDTSAGTILSASGKYIGRTANSNGLDVSTSATLTNTISINNGNAIIASTGGRNLGFNNDTGQKRFRYLGSGSAIQLYKKDDGRHSLTGVASPTDGGTLAFTVNSVAGNKAAEGDNVTVTATAATGYTFGSFTQPTGVTNWSANGNTASFTMPDADVTVTANFTAIPTYAITIDSNITGGSVSASHSGSQMAGQTITLTATPADGYQFSGWNVYKTDETSTKVTVDANNQFTMPAYGVTVSATFTAINYPISTAVTNVGVGNAGDASSAGCAVWMKDGFEVISDVANSTVGTTVKVQLHTVTNWMVDGISVVDGSNNEITTTVVDATATDGPIYSFVMPASAVTITGKFTPWRPEVRMAGRFNGRTTSTWVSDNSGPLFTYNSSNDTYTIDVYFSGASDNYFYFRAGGNDLKAADGDESNYGLISSNIYSVTHSLGGSRNFEMTVPGVYTFTINGARTTLNIAAKNTYALAFAPAAGEVETGTSVSASCAQLASDIEAIQTADNGAQGSVTAEVSGDNSTWASSYEFAIADVGSKTIYGRAAIGNIAVTGTASYTVQRENTSNIFELVTDASQLEANGKYIIANGKSGSVYVMSKTQNTNNRASVTNTANDNKITISSDEVVLTLGGDATNGWSFFDPTYDSNSGGYLYAANSASGKNNYLKTQASNDLNGLASISIDDTDNNAVITFGGSHNDRQTIRFNSASDQLIFSCYQSTSVQPVYLFKQVAEEEKDFAITYAAGTNGSVTGAEGANAEETVTVTVTASEGYAASGAPTVATSDSNNPTLSVTDNSDGTYSFTVPANLASGSTITVTPPAFVQAYPITCVAVPADGGTVTTSVESAPQGAIVGVTATPANDYQLVSVIYSWNNGASSNNITTQMEFEMPGYPTTVTATFAKIPHTFTVVSANGSVSGLPENAVSGTSVTFRVNPNPGYVVSSVSGTFNNGSGTLSITDNGDGTYTFNMPASDVAITVTYFASEEYTLLTNLADIHAGETYLLVGGAASGTTKSYVMGNTLSSQKINGVELNSSNYSNDIISSTEDMAIVDFLVQGEGDNKTYAIHTANGYLNNTSSSNNGISYSNTPVYATITLGSDSKATIQLVDNTGMGTLSYNTNGNLWKFYGGTFGANYIFKRAKGVATPIIAGIPAVDQNLGTYNFIGRDTVSISCTTEGATLEYSLDGGTNWTAYTEPFEITAVAAGNTVEVTARASATVEGESTSKTATATFTCIKPRKPYFGTNWDGESDVTSYNPMFIYPKRPLAANIIGSEDTKAYGEAASVFYYSTDGNAPTIDAAHKVTMKNSSGEFIFLDEIAELQVVKVINGIASDPASGIIDFEVAAPAISLDGGTYDGDQTTRLTTETKTNQNNVSWTTKMYYTTGSTEFAMDATTGEVTSSEWQEYDVSTPISILVENSPVTLKAITVANYYGGAYNGSTVNLGNSGGKWKKSDVTTATYTLTVANLDVIFSPAGGNYLYAKDVALTPVNAVGNVTIHYSTSGTADATSPVYTGPIHVKKGTTTISVYAVDSRESGNPTVENGGVYTKAHTYNIGVQEPLFSPYPGEYPGAGDYYVVPDDTSTAVNVEIFDVSPGAEIYYTVSKNTLGDYNTKPATPTKSSTKFTGTPITLVPGNTYVFSAIAYVGNQASNVRTRAFTVRTNTESGNYWYSIKEMNEETSHSTTKTLANPVEVIYMNTYQNDGKTPEFAFVRDNTGYGYIYFGNNATGMRGYTIYKQGDWIKGMTIKGKAQAWNSSFINEIIVSSTQSEWNAGYLDNRTLIPETTTCKDIRDGWGYPDGTFSGQATTATQSGWSDGNYADYVTDKNIFGHYVHLRKNTITGTGSIQTSPAKRSGTITGELGIPLCYYDGLYLHSGYKPVWNGDNLTITYDESNDLYQSKFDAIQNKGGTFDVYAIVYFYGPYSNNSKWNNAPFEVFPIAFDHIFPPIFNLAGDGTAADMTIDNPERTRYEATTLTLSCETRGAVIMYKTSDMEDFAVYNGEIINVDKTMTIETYSLHSTEHFDQLESKVRTLTINMGSVEQPVISPESVMRAIGGEAVNASISCSTEGATIWYTTDGSDPRDDTNAGRYEYNAGGSNPALTGISSTTTVRAIAEADGFYSVEAEPKTYTFVKSNGIVYDLVTSEADLKEGAIYVIVSKEYNMAMQRSQKENNRDQSPVLFLQPGDEGYVAEKTKVYGNDDLAVFTLHKFAGTGPNWTLHTSNGVNNASIGYLYGQASGTTNQLKTEFTLDNEGKTEAYIEIDSDGMAHISFVKPDEPRYLRYNHSFNLFNSYTNESTGDPVYLYKKDAFPLANIEKKGVKNQQYTVADELIGVYAQGNKLWAKDQAVSIDANDKPEGYSDFLLEEAFIGEAKSELSSNNINVPNRYLQNNWVVLIMPEGTDAADYDAADYVDAYIPAASVIGELTDDVNYTITLKQAPGAPINMSTDELYVKNVYAPTSFVNTYWGENDDNIYFVKPKVQEVANIAWAVWDGSKFNMPETCPAGSFAISDFSLNSDPAPTLEIGKAYAFMAVMENGGSPSGIRRLKSVDSPATFNIKPLNLSSSSPVTGIDNVGGSVKEVKSVRVYNVAGVEQRELQPGVNIVVTTYTDGTRSTAKVLR